MQSRTPTVLTTGLAMLVVRGGPSGPPVRRPGGEQPSDVNGG